MYLSLTTPATPDIRAAVYETISPFLFLNKFSVVNNNSGNDSVKKIVSKLSVDLNDLQKLDEKIKQAIETKEKLLKELRRYLETKKNEIK